MKLKTGQYGAVTEFGQIVLVSTADSFDKAVQAQPLQVTRNLTGAETVQVSLEVGVTKSRNSMFAASYGAHDLQVVIADLDKLQFRARHNFDFDPKLVSI